MYQYVLFDLDGTLTDPKEGICKSVQHALKSFGIIENDIDKLEPFIGPPLKESFMNFYSLTGEEAEEAIRVYRERFSTIGLYENKIYPGIHDMLARLKKEGCHLAVASSKPTVFVEKILKYFSILDCFEVVVGSELDGTRTKKEDVVKETLSRLFPDGTINKQAAVMVGDRKFDVEGAKEFGLDSIGVEYGYAQGNELAQAGATYVVKNVKELERVIKGKQEPKVQKTENTQKTENIQKTEKTHETMKTASKTADGKLSTKKEESLTPLMKIWNLALPVFLYYISCSLFIFAMQMIVSLVCAKMGVQASAWLITHADMVDVTLNGIGMLIGLFLIRRMFLQEVLGSATDIVIPTGKMTRAWMIRGFLNIPRRGLKLAAVILLAITLPLFVNLVLSSFQIQQLSDTYESISNAQYSVPIWLGLILYGFISPIAEEALFRGILYNRMKRYYSKIPAIVMVSVLFGFYHMNLVQGIYGALIGLVIALCYEWTKSFLTAFVFHSVANITLFLISQNDMLSIMLTHWISYVVLGVLSACIFVYLWFLCNRSE